MPWKYTLSSLTIIYLQQMLYVTGQNFKNLYGENENISNVSRFVYDASYAFIQLTLFPLKFAPLIFAPPIFAHPHILRPINFRTSLFYSKFAVFYSFMAFFLLPLIFEHSYCANLLPLNFAQDRCAKN